MMRLFIALLLTTVLAFLPTAGSPAHADVAVTPSFAITAVHTSFAALDDEEDEEDPEPPVPEDPDESANDGPDDDETEESDDRYLAIVGGTVHTVSGPVLRRTRILAKNGKIKAISPHVQIPDEAEVIDATGHHVYPGLIAVRSTGILGSGSAEDSTDVFSLQMATALAGGVTTAVSGANAYKLLYGELDDMIVGEDLFVSLNYTTSNPGARRRLRETLNRLQQHLRDKEAYRRASEQGDDEAEEPSDNWIRGRTEELYRLLKGEAVAISNAGTAHHLKQLAELADRFGLTIVVRGAHEAWTIAPEMSRAGMHAIISPRQRVDHDERLNRPTGSSIENAATLHDHGVPFAIVPQWPAVTFSGLGGRDLLHLRMEAAFAVRGGLSNQAALRAITLDAARVLGVDHRIGSIDVGKDADFVIADGDLLHYMTHARWTIVNGKVMYDKQKDTLFDHIRPDGDMDAPPPDDHWPRRLGEPF